MLNDFVSKVKDQGANDRQLHDRLTEWILHESLVPYLKIPLMFDATRVWQEIQEVERHQLFVNYKSRYEVMDQPSRDWQACAVYGVAARKPQNPISDQQQFANKTSVNHWTEAAELMPHFCQWVTANVGQPRRMLIMKFPPGGFVPPHRDLGPDADIQRYHLPQVNFHVRWPVGSQWFMEDCIDGVHPTQDGTVTMHSFFHEHAVINDNLLENRYFIYGFFDYLPKFRALILQAFMDQIQHSM
jgi:hypothetical protein